MDCSAEKRPLMGQYKLLSSYATKRLHSIAAAAHHWLDIQKQEGFTTFSRKHTIGLVRPPMYTNSCLDASLVDKTGHQKRLDDGFNCFHPVNL